MAELKNKTGSFFYLKLAVALIFLVNPCIKTFDILPDFVSAFIVARLIHDFCERAPIFSEAKDAFIKLGWISFLKLPALVIIALVRSMDTNDNDIVTLFSFVFAIFECYVLIFAVKKLFDALMHLGMRGATVTITPFSVFGKKLLMRPETLRLFCFVFAVVRSLSYSLPEMILLATSYKIGDATEIFNAWALYPKVLLACVIITLIFGLIVAVLFFKYAKTIKKDGSLRATLGLLHNEAERAEIEELINTKALISRLKFFMISSVFALDMVFDGTDGFDILPNFIYGIILFIAVSLLFKSSFIKKLSQIFTAVYTVISLATLILISDFSANYDYASLIHSTAKSAFVPVLLASGLEFLSLAVCMVFIGILLYKFTKEHTGIETIASLSAERERKTKLNATLFAVFGSLSALTKFLSYVFEYNQVTSEVLINGQTRIITTSLLPWFDSVGFVITLIFIAYSYFYYTSLSEDIELKYS